MSKATAFNAKWWDGNSVPSTGKLRVSFAYESSDEAGSIVLRSSDNLAVAIAKEDLLEALREILYPDLLILPVTSGEIITTSQLVPVIQTPEPKVIEPIYDRLARKKRRPQHLDRSVPNAAKDWTTKEEEVLMTNYKALGVYVDESGGKALLYETTAKQLGRSAKAIRARHHKLKRQGRL